MRKDQIIKIAAAYGFEFKDKNYKDEYVLEKPNGHTITSPTLEGLKNMLEKHGK